MAGVATTTTLLARSVWGNKRVVIAKLVFDTGDYADGGISVTAAQFGLNSIDAVLPQGAAFGTAVGYPVAYDAGTGKIVVLLSAADGDPMDESGAVAMVASTLYVVVIGN